MSLLGKTEIEINTKLSSVIIEITERVIKGIEQRKTKLEKSVIIIIEVLKNLKNNPD